MLDQFPFSKVDPEPGDLKGMRVVLLNGPPGCGKDTAGKILMKHCLDHSVTTGKLSRRLKESVHADHGYPALPHDYFENSKESPLPLFFGKTPRQAYIYKSEKIVKPHYGNEYYGRLLLRDMLVEYKKGIRVMFITDSGFVEEVNPIVDVVGISNVLLVRIHADERGKTFKGDSRSYIKIPGVQTVDVDNNVICAFRQNLYHEVSSWLHECDYWD
jgi:hypothetical protein